MELDIKILNAAVRTANTHSLALPDGELKTSVMYLASIGNAIIESIADYDLLVITGEQIEAKRIVLNTNEEE